MIVHKTWKYKKKPTNDEYLIPTFKLSEYVCIFKHFDEEIKIKIEDYSKRLEIFPKLNCIFFCWRNKHIAPEGFIGDLEAIVDRIQTFLNYDIAHYRMYYEFGKNFDESLNLNEFSFGIRANYQDMPILQIDSFIYNPTTITPEGGSLIFRSQFIMKNKEDVFYWCGNPEEVL